MKSLIKEKTKEGFYLSNKLIPLAISKAYPKTENKIRSRRFEPIAKVPGLGLLHRFGQGALEISFSSISDISIECVELLDNSVRHNTKALLLSVKNDAGKSNSYLVDLNSLISSGSKVGVEELTGSNNNFRDLYHTLSLREQKVLHEVSKGNTSNEIASKFFISSNTVKNHRKNIKKKLSFANNLEYSKFLKWSLEYCGER